MSGAADIWTPHLASGERLVWSATASSAMRMADRSRHRLIHGAAGAACLLIGFMLLARFIESAFLVAAQPSLIAAVAPLYLGFGLAMLALSVWGFRRMGEKPPAAMHYAVTSHRLLALDESGGLVSEMPGAGIDAVIASGRRRTPDVYVLRKDDPKEEHVFAIEHIETPLEAKAVIEDTFLATPIESAEGTA